MVILLRIKIRIMTAKDLFKDHEQVMWALELKSTDEVEKIIISTWSLDEVDSYKEETFQIYLKLIFPNGSKVDYNMPETENMAWNPSGRKYKYVDFKVGKVWLAIIAGQEGILELAKNLGLDYIFHPKPPPID